MRRISFLVAALMAFGAGSFAQTTFATITGLVTDPNGAVIAGAAVTATHAESNYRYSAKSNDSG